MKKSATSHALIGSNVRAARLALGLTMHQLAERVSVIEGAAVPLTWQAVQQWERGASSPRNSRLDAVASALGLSIPQLLGLPACFDAKEIRNAAIREAMAAIAETDSRKQALEIMEGMLA